VFIGRGHSKRTAPSFRPGTLLTTMKVMAGFSLQVTWLGAYTCSTSFSRATH
jgi:hypothetical protein